MGKSTEPHNQATLPQGKKYRQVLNRMVILLHRQNSELLDTVKPRGYIINRHVQR